MSDLDYEGVIILGFPRSGTTLLRRLFDAHPSLCCPPETHVLRACSRFLQEDYSAGGLSVSAIAGLSFSGIDEDRVITSIREMAFGFFRDIAAKSGKPIWVEKTAFDIFHIDDIERLCERKCRYICTTRHPLDVVYSVREMIDKFEVYMPELHAYIQRYPNPLEAFAHAWVDVSKNLLEFMERNPQSSIRLSYESLVEDADTEMQRLFTFLDLPIDTNGYTKNALSMKENIGYGDWKTYEKSEISTSSSRRWKSLSDETLNRLAAILNPIMPQLGYDLIETKDLQSAEEARHRFELGRLISGMTKSE